MIKRGVVLAGDKTRAIFGYMRQLAVTHNMGRRIFGLEFLEELVHRVLLSLCAGVSRLAVLIQTTFIADAKGAMVVVTGMNALHRLWQQRDDVAIAQDVVVIRALSVLGFACSDEGFNAERAVAFRCTAVDDEQLHIGVLQRFQCFAHRAGALKPGWRTRLNSDCTQDGSYNCSNDLEDLFNG